MVSKVRAGAHLGLLNMAVSLQQIKNYYVHCSKKHTDVSLYFLLGNNMSYIWKEVLQKRFMEEKNTKSTENSWNQQSVFVFVQDLAQYINEVKRDNETLREIDQYQRSIENLV